MENKIQLLDGKEHVLKYTFKAIERLETEASINLLSPGDTFKDMKLTVLRDLLWAGLLHENPSLSRGEVSDLIDVKALPSVLGCIEAAIKQSLGA